MTEADLFAFRLNLRVELLQRLVLMQSLIEPVMNGHATIEKRLQDLYRWLDTNADTAGRLTGEKFREPAQTAVYSEEATAVAEQMKEILAKLAAAYNGT